MKRTISILIRILVVLVMLLPLGKILSSCFGYTFDVISVPALAIVIAILSVCVVVLDIIHKNTIESKAIGFFLAMITPLSLINIVFYVLVCNHILVFISATIFSGCCCFFTIKHGKPIALKIVALVLSALMFLPIGFAALVALFPIGQNTVVQTKESPSGRYYAEVIDSDQGALGGDTIVNVYEKWEINLLLFKIEKKPQQVYFGEWGEFKNMEIYWKNDNCIVINSAEYKIE